MSQENVEIVGKAIEAWNQREADLLLSYAAPEVEWMPAGPAAVERTVYRGYEEVATGFAAVWETWEEFRFQESAIHAVLRNGKVTAARTFLAWEEALAAAGLPE